MGTVSTDSTYTFTVAGNRSLTAVFEAITPSYTITILIDPTAAGTVTGAGTYEEGQTATLTYTASDGYNFSGWYSGGTLLSTSNPYSFQPTSSMTITAKAAQIPAYTITATIDPSGSGTVTGAGQYQQGATVTLVATAGDGYEFSGWQEGGQTVSTGATYTFTATEDRTLTAAFEETSQYVSGVDWWGATLPMSAYWYGATYGSGKFLAISGYTGNATAYSANGINWTTGSLPSFTKNWKSVAYGNGKFVAVASNVSSAAYSADGISWTATTLPSSANWVSVTFGAGKFVAIANGTNNAVYSTDGVNWTATTLPSSASWMNVTYGNGKFVTVAYSSNKASYSTDGINWKASTLPSSGNWVWVAYGGEKFVAIAGINGTNKAAYSADGISWTATSLPVSAKWTCATYGDGKFVAVAKGTNKAAYSADGISWTATTLPSSGNWYRVICGDGKFVALVQQGTTAAYSSRKGPGV